MVKHGRLNTVAPEAKRVGTFGHNVSASSFYSSTITRYLSNPSLSSGTISQIYTFSSIDSGDFLVFIFVHPNPKAATNEIQQAATLRYYI